MNLNLQQLRYLCDKSFFYFVKTFGGPKSGKDASKRIHKPLCDFWQSKTLKRKAIFLPRGWFKSTIFTKWGGIWKYLQDNEVRILIASENQDNASRFLKFIREQMLKNKFLRKVYPELKLLTKEWRNDKENRWSGKQVDLPREGVYSEATFTAIGVGGAAQSGHYTDIHIDDLVGKKAMESKIVMRSIFSWHDNTKELLEDPNFDSSDGSNILIIGTHWSPADYGCYVQKNYPEYKWMITPCLKDDNLKDEENITWHQNSGISQGESNWPESPKYTTEHYQNMRANPEEERKFWSQHMNNPHKATGLTKIEKEWIHFYRIEERAKDTYLICDKCNIEVKLSEIPLYGMADVAGFGETKSVKGAARNALLVGGQPIDMIQKFVVFAWAKRLKKPSVFREKLYETHKEYKPRVWRIDDKGVGSTMFGDILEERQKRCPHMNISPLPHDTEKGIKDSDIQALINPAANGEIHLHQTMTNLISEMTEYPDGFTVDLLDMLAKLNRLYWMRTKMVDVSKFAEESHVWSVQSRDGVTGY